MKKYNYDVKTKIHTLTLYGKFYSWLIKYEVYNRFYRKCYQFWHGKVSSWRYRNKFRKECDLVLAFIVEFILWPLGIDKKRKWLLYDCPINILLKNKL